MALLVVAVLLIVVTESLQPAAPEHSLPAAPKKVID